MRNNLVHRIGALRSLIESFLGGRRDSKLEKISPSDPKYQEICEEHEPQAWLASAAKRVAQIQAATHTLKPIHPSAQGTNLFCHPRDLAPLALVGSHVLGDDFTVDVVGNAAALDVYKFLKLSHEGRSLQEMAQARDPDLAAALTPDAVQAESWMDAFASLNEARGPLASHGLAKQIYWPVGEDPHDDTAYHLLAPLYASSLTHRVHATIQNDRFGDEAKAAREARRNGEFSAQPVREYPHLAIQKLGGSKPLNVSQLNSERLGQNLLLASLPPAWQSEPIKPLHGSATMFYPYGQRAEVRRLVRVLRGFLKSDPTPNVHTRERRAGLVEDLIDEFLQFTAELRTLVPGWSQQPQCRLSPAERHWLDPQGEVDALEAAGLPPPADTVHRISEGFAVWLNEQLAAALPVGEAEFREWRKRALEEIKADERGMRHDD